MESALLDESGRWRALERVPTAEGECYPTSVTLSTGVVGSFCGEVAWFDAATEAWQSIAGLASTKVVVTNDAVVGIVDTDRDETTVVEYLLPPN